MVEEEVGHSEAGMTKPSSPRPFVHGGLLQLSQEVSVSMEMCCTDSEVLSRRFRHNSERISLSVSAEKSMKSVLKVPPKKDDLVLFLNDYKESKETLERKICNRKIF